MNPGTKIEAKVVHLTPPQQFQVAHQVPEEMTTAGAEAGSKTTRRWYKVISANGSRIMAVKLINGPWFVVSLILKQCRRIDKNLLVAIGAIALLLLQVVLMVSEAQAFGPREWRLHLSGATGQRLTPVNQRSIYPWEPPLIRVLAQKNVTEKSALAGAICRNLPQHQLSSTRRSGGVLVLFRCRKRTRPLPAAMSGLREKSMFPAYTAVSPRRGKVPDPSAFVENSPPVTRHRSEQSQLCGIGVPQMIASTNPHTRTYYLKPIT